MARDNQTRSLFDDESEAPYQRHSQTSFDAAEQIEPNAGTLRAEVLEHIRKYAAYGCTDEEIQDRLRMNPSTQRPRRVELVEYGWVKDSGRTRKTRSGRNAVVWVALPKPGGTQWT